MYSVCINCVSSASTLLLPDLSFANTEKNGIFTSCYSFTSLRKNRIQENYQKSGNISLSEVFIGSSIFWQVLLAKLCADVITLNLC